MSLRGYFALVGAGTTTILRSALVARLGAGEHAALRAAGLARAGREAESWRCDQTAKRCARAVVEAAPGGASPFVALCEGADDDDRCPAIDLTAEDLAQETLGLGDLMRVLRGLYRLEGDPPAPPAASALAAPLLLGVDRFEDAPRDVFLALRLDAAALPLFLTVRERVPRASLVLVPTAHRLPADLAVRYAPGAHVELAILEDAITVRDGAIALAPRLRLLAPPHAEDAAPSKPRGPIAAELGATQWSEIKITVVDGHTLRIQLGKKTLRRTYVDLGLASRGSREPTRKWDLLVAICAGHGGFRWKTLGSFDAAKNAVAVLRKKLKDAFGLTEDPFRDFNVAEGWRARFFASSEIAANDDQA